MTSPSDPPDDSEGLVHVENAIGNLSRPSELKIADMRLAVVASSYAYPIFRIHTNQGVYGLGVDLNLQTLAANMRTPGELFGPADAWNAPKPGFWRPDDRWKE